MRNTDADYLYSIQIHHLHITVNKNVLIHLVAVDCIPKVCDNLSWFIHPSYLESLIDVLLLQVFIHAKKNQSANGIGKSRIRLPYRFWHLSLRFLAFKCHPFAFQQCLSYSFFVYAHIFITFLFRESVDP